MNRNFLAVITKGSQEADESDLEVEEAIRAILEHSLWVDLAPNKAVLSYGVRVTPSRAHLPPALISRQKDGTYVMMRTKDAKDLLQPLPIINLRDTLNVSDTRMSFLRSPYSELWPEKINLGQQRAWVFPLVALRKLAPNLPTELFRSPEPTMWGKSFIK